MASQIRARKDQPEAGDKAGSGASPPIPSKSSPTGSLLYAVGLSLARTVIAREAVQAVHRSSIFLILFICIHLLGNLFIFVGRDAFNSYGYFLHTNPLLPIVETYLAISFLVHFVTGLVLSWRKRALIARQPMVYGKLLVSALFVTAFLCVHLKNFKFGPDHLHKLQKDVWMPLKGTVTSGTEMRDIYQIALDLFQDPVATYGYVAAVVVIGAHLWWGWSKAVMKMSSIPAQHRSAAVLTGRGLVVALVCGFSSCPLYTHHVVLAGGGV